MTEHDLEKFAVLKVRKSTMPPGASLVVCYDDGSGVPVLADDMYSEYVVVRRGDLEWIVRLTERKSQDAKYSPKFFRLKAALKAAREKP